MTTDKTYKILCFLDYDHGRDVEILLPLIYCAEQYMQAKVYFAFLFEIHRIYREQPDLVLLANAIGSPKHFQISRYAKQNGIPVFALISEGMFPTDGSYNYWGYNTDKKLYQEYICLWSEKTRKALAESYPTYAERMVCTGAVGFDRYKICRFLSKQDYLKRQNKTKYKKVICYAGWSFGRMFNPNGIEELKEQHGENYQVVRTRMYEQMKRVEEILRQAVMNHPDILFVFKRHPNEKHPHLTQSDCNEMVNLSSFPNVMYTLDTPVHDLISIADIFCAYESTTTMESWLMKPETPTLLLRPEGADKGSAINQGSLRIKDYAGFRHRIQEFYDTHTVQDFFSQDKIDTRQKLFREMIGYADGLNHVRTAKYLRETLQNLSANPKPKVKLRFSHLLTYLLIHTGKRFYNKKLFLKLPKLKKTVFVFEYLSLPGLPRLQKRRYQELKQFHTQHKDQIRQLLNL